jgi:hypothetical protein
MNKTTEVRANRYASCTPDVRAWAQQQGYENLREHFDISSAIHNQAVTTLTVLLAGIAGSLAYAKDLFGPRPEAIAFGAAAVCVYLCVLAALLVMLCINLEAAPMLHNEPDHLMEHPNATLEALVVGELANVQARIDRMKRRNDIRAQRLNSLRLLAIATPILFALVAVYNR